MDEEIEETRDDHHGKKVQLNVDMPEQIRDLARAMAVERGVPLGAMIAALIERERDLQATVSAMRTDPLRVISHRAAVAGAAAEAGDRARTYESLMDIAWNPIIYSGLAMAEVTQLLKGLGDFQDAPDEVLFDAAKSIRSMVGRILLQSQKIEESRIK